MDNRDVQYPNRFKMVKVPGTDDIFEVSPAPGNVYTEGTFWNKGNVLKDATAALYGKGPEAVPDDIFAAIPSMIQASTAVAEGRARVETGSYTGTEDYGAKDEVRTKSLNFTINPQIIFIVDTQFNMQDPTNTFPSGIAIFLNPAKVALYLSTRSLSSVNIFEISGGGIQSVVWSGNSVSWSYSVAQYGNSYAFQWQSLNLKYHAYHYIAIG